MSDHDAAHGAHDDDHDAGAQDASGHGSADHDSAGGHGHDDHGHEEGHGIGALGPIDWRMWGIGVVGVVSALIVVGGFVAATAFSFTA